MVVETRRGGVWQRAPTTVVRDARASTMVIASCYGLRKGSSA